MLNKENLFCVSSSAPEPGYVPAKLTIARYRLPFNSSYGYRRNSYGELNPNVINDVSIEEIRVSRNIAHATTPFYWNDKKYSEGAEAQDLQSQWVNLVDQTVDIWLSGGGNTYSCKVFERILQKLWRILAC